MVKIGCFLSIMDIQTNRLRLHELTLNDAYRLSEYRNKKQVSLYQSWHHFTLKNAEKLINDVIKHPFTGKKYEHTQLGIYLNEYLIGDLHVDVLSEKLISIGYTLDSTYWRQGYAIEAVSYFLAYLKETYHFEKVIAYIYKKNERSRRLLIKLGFEIFESKPFSTKEGYILFL